MVPPSAVSAAIKKLEKELNVQLFDRTANKIILNTSGKQFTDQVQSALEKLDGALNQFALPSDPIPCIHILIRARPKWISELIVEYMQQNPQVRFIISNDYARETIEPFDLVIDQPSDRYKGWHSFLLSTELLCIKAASTSKWASQALTFRQLADEVFIFPSLGNGMRNLYEQLCDKHKIAPNIGIECNDRQLLQYYVQSGLGLTIGACRSLDDHTQNDIIPLNVTDFNEIQTVYVFQKREQENNPIIRNFCRYLQSKRYVQV